jgi:hypothetical protein
MVLIARYIEEKEKQKTKTAFYINKIDYISFRKENWGLGERSLAQQI